VVVVTMTERDLRALRFAGEQYAVPMATVADLIAPGLRAGAQVARRTAGRLEALGYADRRPLLGQAWLTPTRAGLRAAGLPYRVLVPPEGQLEHVATVARLRLHLAAAYPGATWESERSIREHWGGTRVRRADGALWQPGTGIGIEVELHVKRPERYAGIVHDTDPGWSAVWWFTPAALVPLLTDRLATAGGTAHRVYPLPEGVSR
jgi:hypothetical protein